MRERHIRHTARRVVSTHSDCPILADPHPPSKLAPEPPPPPERRLEMVTKDKPPPPRWCKLVQLLNKLVFLKLFTCPDRTKRTRAPERGSTDGTAHYQLLMQSPNIAEIPNSLIHV